MTTTKIYFLENGQRSDGDLLGLKGANLCEMAKVVDVPQGFILSTKITGGVTADVEHECLEALRKLEEKTQRVYNPQYYQSAKPLLLSIRGSPTRPIPGLMHSMLNVGINDSIVEMLATMPGGSRRFALDTYLRFLQMFGSFVLSVDSKFYDDAIKLVKQQEGVKTEVELSEHGLEQVVTLFKLIANVPQDPMTQFWMIIKKLYETMDEHVYTTPESIDDEKLAIIVQRMVFGNLNSRSGAGTCFSSVVNVGGNLHGNFLSFAEGNDFNLNDHRSPQVLPDVGREVYLKLESSMKLLELHFHHNFQYVEYTVEDGHLFFLETNCVKSNPMLHKGNYLVNIENNIDDRALCDGSTDSSHPIPQHQYVLMRSPDIDEAVTSNPLLATTDVSLTI